MKKLLILIFCLLIALTSCVKSPQKPVFETVSVSSNSQDVITLENIPEFDGENAFVAVNNNLPFFTQNEITNKSFETYSPLDNLGRCTVAFACVGRDIMPTEERGSIGQVKPTGWQTAKYDFVDGKYLYNRCHLIGFQLTGENANNRNLITGTRYLNISGMLPFENMIADYVKETDNHVLFRVTPIFEGENLVASGVLMEAYSVEDEGEGICFNVYAYNVQPGVEINYKTGDNKLSNNVSVPKDNEIKEFVLNTNSKKFHKTTCSGAKSISEKNRQTVTTTREELINSGYSPCQTCNP